MLKKKKYYFGVTLLELLIAVLLLGVVIITFASIHRFVYFQMIASDRRAVLQNEGYLILEHITKTLQNVSPLNVFTLEPINVGSISGAEGDMVFVKIRLADNGTEFPWEDDTIVYYKWTNIAEGGFPCFKEYSLSYCPPHNNDHTIIGPGDIACSYGGGSPSGESSQPLSCGHVADFDVTVSQNSSLVDINLIMRHDPFLPVSIDNPEVNLTTSVRLPGIPAR